MTRLVSVNIFWNFFDVLKSLRDTWFRPSVADSEYIEVPGVFKRDSCPPLLGFSSGRAALEFALQRFSEKRSNIKEVIVPLYICNAVIDSIVRAGLIPVFCNIGKDLNICPDSCMEKVSPNTLAVLVAHTYGYPAKIHEIVSRVKKESTDIFVIDDAASGMGTMCESSYLGLSGDVGIFSFNQGKAITATGGGLLAINKLALAEPFLQEYRGVPRIGSVRKCIETLRFCWNFKVPYVSNVFNYYFARILNSDVFCHKPLCGYRLSRFDHHLVCNCLENTAHINSRRQEIIDFYLENLKGIEGIFVPQNSDGLFLGRFCVYIPGLGRLKGDPIADPSLFFRAKKIHFQYGYPPFAKQYVDTPEFEEGFRFIDELLVLPVNPYVSVLGHLRVIGALCQIVRKISET